MLIKPCWHTDEYGNKCGNRGTKYSIVEEEIQKAILKYKEDILPTDTETQGSNNIEHLKQMLEEKQKDLNKYTSALERVNDAYDLGEYTKDEWIKRKSKWEQQISDTKNDIYGLEMQVYRSESMSNVERLNLINEFIDNIDNIDDPADRNRLYKTIIDSVIWTKQGEDANIEINFL